MKLYKCTFQYPWDPKPTVVIWVLSNTLAPVEKTATHAAWEYLKEHWHKGGISLYEVHDMLYEIRCECHEHERIYFSEEIDEINRIDWT